MKRLSTVLKEVLVGVLIVIYVAYSLLQSWKRKRALGQLAPKLGLSFDAEGNDRLVRMLSFAPLFSRGNTQAMTNLLRGERNQLPIAIFDLVYATRSYTRRSRDRISQTVMAVHLTKGSLPVFTLAQRSLMNSIGELLGGACIELGSHDFQSNYHLTGPNEEKIRALFNGNVIAFFEDYTNLWVEGFDQWFLIYRYNFLVSPDDLESFMNLGLQAAALFQV